MPTKQLTRVSVLVLILALLATMPFTNRAYASKTQVTYQYLVGAGPLCALGPDACPDIAVSSSNGDMVAVNGTGTLTVHPDSVTGSGNFVHMDSSGNVKGMGTWTAVQLLSFVSYGSGAAQGLPPNFFGGEALIRVHLSAGFDAILKITCVLGNPPAGKMEGIRLTVQGVINFNKQVSGDTLFILS